MADDDSEKLRRALREAKTGLGDAIGRTDRTIPGDRKAAQKLQEAYTNVAVLLQELESGRWTGRTVSPSAYEAG